MPNDSSIFSELIANGEFQVDDKGHAILNGQFLLMVPPPVILKLQERLEEELGREGMQELLVEMGEYQVEQALDRYKERYGMEEVSREKILSYVSNVLKVLGWGKIEIKGAESDEIKIVVEHPTLPSVYRNREDELSNEPICHYLRGLLSKSMDVTQSGDVNLEETQCAATGGDICVFENTTS